MLTYKDKTWCPHKHCALYSNCPHDRAISKKEKQKAKDFGLPICLYNGIPDCFKTHQEVEDEDNS